MKNTVIKLILLLKAYTLYSTLVEVHFWPLNGFGDTCQAEIWIFCTFLCQDLSGTRKSGTYGRAVLKVKGLEFVPQLSILRMILVLSSKN